MSSWVYVFSQFTPEALLFEGLAICLLCGFYAAFYVLRKRRLGVAGEVIPAGVVRSYLGELIGDAEGLRAQLFGLLSSAGVKVNMDSLRIMASAAPAGTPTTQLDPALAARVAELEARMTEQLKAVEGLTADKERLEKELAAAKSASGGKSAGDGAPAELINKIQSLEAKLAEYSVIEDDLANLKRLQQENAQLKAALGGAAAGGAVAAGAAAAAEPAVAEAAPADAAPPGADFENLVDQVEQSLTPGAGEAQTTEAAAASVLETGESTAMPTAVEEIAAAGDAAPVPAEGGAAPAAGDGKSDADLVAEFEKMLNS